MINFRIYANKQGWELVTIKREEHEVQQVVSILEKNEVSDILVIKHDTELDQDETYLLKIKKS